MKRTSWIGLAAGFAMILMGFARADIARAEEIMKNPRVVELEDSLKENASDYVRTRFPSVPFMVTVSVDPMRRDLSKADQTSDDLPYFDSGDGDEVRDEWDNPQVPLNALINRVKKIQVSIAVPAKLKESDVNELKQGIFDVLHLTPARDQVEISRRDWTTDEVPWTILYFSGAALCALLIGLLIINRTSANKIAKTVANLKLMGNSNNSSQMLTPAMPAMENDSNGNSRSQSQELKFNDPIKMKELAARHIEFLMNSQKFPNHQDIFVLDGLGKENPEKLGAILAEFPSEMQRKLFSYSSEFHWIEALNAPGFLDFECLEVLQTLTQNPREKDNLDWDHAVLTVWRLLDQRTQFLRGLPKDEAFALLLDMPKAVAVSEARKAFPGAWGVILDPTYKVAAISPKRVREIQEAATRVLALNELELVKRYRADKELMDYLQTVDPAEERDIYGASPKDSMIHKFRPPFYPLFEQSEETLKEFVPAIALDQWALALFNTPKSERSRIEQHLSDKQRFLLVERFKQLDLKPPEKAAVGRAREQIAKIMKKWLTEVDSVMKAASLNKTTTNGEDDGGSISTAA